MLGLSKQQSTLWGIQVGITHAYNKGFDRMEVDTMNIKVFDIIDFQYVILVPRAFSHVVTQLNTRHSNY